MRSRPGSAPSDTTALLDDFEWPPRADDLSVHEIDADPWRTIEADDSSDATAVIFEPDPPAPAGPAAPAPRR